MGIGFRRNRKIFFFATVSKFGIGEKDVLAMYAHSTWDRGSRQ
jgi:hypothetical protein